MDQSTEPLPQCGGSYTRDPKSGALILNTPGAEANVPVDPDAVASGEGIKPAATKE
jgi:hypothetical protein